MERIEGISLEKMIELDRLNDDGLWFFIRNDPKRLTKKYTAWFRPDEEVEDMQRFDANTFAQCINWILERYALWKAQEGGMSHD